jgi:hypothetical protein
VNDPLWQAENVGARLVASANAQVKFTPALGEENVKPGVLFLLGLGGAVSMWTAGTAVSTVKA